MKFDSATLHRFCCPISVLPHLWIFGLLLSGMCCSAESNTGIKVKRDVSLLDRSCDPAYCLNKGECFLKSRNARYCKCRVGYDGTRCQFYSLEIYCLTFYIDADEKGVAVRLPPQCQGLPTIVGTALSTAAATEMLQLRNQTTSFHSPLPTVPSSASVEADSTIPAGTIQPDTAATVTGVPALTVTSDTFPITVGTQTASVRPPTSVHSTGLRSSSSSHSSPNPSSELTVTPGATEVVPTEATSAETVSMSPTDTTVWPTTPGRKPHKCRELKRLCRKKSPKKLRRYCKCKCERDTRSCKKQLKKKLAASRASSAAMSRNIDSQEASPMDLTQASFRLKRRAVRKTRAAVDSILQLLTETT